MEVSPELFEVLGSSAMLGRALLAGDSDVIAVSYRTWMRYLGGDPGALNRFVRLDGVQYQVVGVMSEGFAFPSRDTDFWISLPPHAADLVRGRSGTVVSAVGRLREGISIEQARAEASSIAAALNVSWIEVVTLLEHTTAPVRPALWVLQAAGVFVLLIACVNITSLLLARTTDRRREFAVRTAVGAGRVRLARHVLTESVLLAALGAIVGYPLSFLGVKLVLPLARSSIPYLDEIGPDPLVLAFTLGVSLTCGLLCGLVPAITMSERELLGSLKMGGLSGTSDRRATRTHALLVIAEVALALVLLVAAGLLITSFRQLATVNPGYSPQGVLTFHVALPDARYPLIEHRRGFYSDLLNRIDELPEVQSAGVTNVLPFRFSMFGTTFSINGIRQPAMAPGGMPYSFKVVSPAYFDSMGIPIVKGRGFRDIDRLNGPPVIALSETFARAHFANEDPIGKYIQFMRHSWEVVGVINDVKHVGLDQEPWAEIYLSYRQLPSTVSGPWLSSMTFALRSNEELRTLVPAIRRLLFQIDPALVVGRVVTMEDLVFNSIARPRFQAVLIGTFALGALLLAAVGVSSVLAYSVRRRTREVGIRIALGAGRTDVVGMVLIRGLGLTVAGMALGLLGAFAVTGYLENMLFAVSPLDPTVLAGAFLVLSAVALFACYLPARRAVRVDPVVALRCE